MSNGDPPPDSGAPYIIICSGRTDAGLANAYDDKVRAVASCAAQFAAFMGQEYGSEDFKADIQPLAHLQHQLMNHAIGVHVLTHDELDAIFVQMFAEMSRLEGEYS